MLVGNGPGNIQHFEFKAKEISDFGEMRYGRSEEGGLLGWIIYLTTTHAICFSAIFLVLLF